MTTQADQIQQAREKLWTAMRRWHVAGHLVLGDAG